MFFLFEGKDLEVSCNIVAAAIKVYQPHDSWHSVACQQPLEGLWWFHGDDLLSQQVNHHAKDFSLKNVNGPVDKALRRPCCFSGMGLREGGSRLTSHD